MKRKQMLAVMLAAAVAAQPQIVKAEEPSSACESVSEISDSIEEKVQNEEIQVNNQGTSLDSKSENIEPDKEIAEGTAAQADVKIQVKKEEKTNTEIDTKEESSSKIGKDTAAKEVEGTLATVRVTSKDVYGIVGGKASLVGNYDQGIPAAPRDGVRWCDGNKNKLEDNADKYGNPESTTMTLRNIEASQDGAQYCLSVTNVVGTAYSPMVTLHVLDAKAEDQTVLEGQNAEFSVKLSGEWGSPVSYQWYDKEGNKIAGATKATYTVENVTSETAGTYKCVVMRGYGRADEYNSKTVCAELTVNKRVLDVKVERNTDKDVVTEGEVVTYTAKPIGDWDENLTYQWFNENGDPLENNDVFSGADTDTLEIISKVDLNETRYYCLVTGKYGSRQSEVITLNVKAEQKDDTQTPGNIDGEDDNVDQDNKANKTNKEEKAEKKSDSTKTKGVKTGDASPIVPLVMLGGTGLAAIYETVRRKLKE